MKEEWLLHGAVVPVDVETTSVLVAEIHRLIGVVGGMALAQSEQEPVAIVAVDGIGQIQIGWIKKPQHNDKLYTSPQPAQRT